MPRTLSIQSSAIPLVLGQPALEPVKLSGREGINSLFEYELLLKTPDALNLGAALAADFNLDDFIGREISCTIQLDGAGEFVPGSIGGSPGRIGAGARQINALVTAAAMWGEEGRHVQYRLTLRPWLHLATLAVDCRIFQNKTVVEILDELLADYAFPVDKRLYGLEVGASGAYPKRDYQTQYNESDFAFFSRLCQEWGISYHFEHSDDTHRLVLSDAMPAYSPNASLAYQAVDYHASGWKTDSEYLHRFVPENRLTSGQYTTRDYDYTQSKADLTVSRSEPRATGRADHEVYQWHADVAGSHYAQPNTGNAATNDRGSEGRQLALLRMQALRAHGARAEASGNLRGMVPGCTFKLQNHPRLAANTEYLILDTRFAIEDVPQDSQRPRAARARAQRWQVSVDLTAHPVNETLRPAATQPKPHTHGPQVALVVGPEGQNLWTDALGRIKVQFPWDRVGQKNQNSTCWLRVASPWAGNQLGGIQIPRIGQEVIVDFIGGDPDLPICTGRVHNQMNLPPWALPAQSALSGFRSRELNEGGGNSAGGRSNHLILDDTPQRIQAQLKSDHLSSSLSLGFITRIEDNAGRQDPRGEGFELRADGHGVVRAQDGLLITTEPRPHAVKHAKDLGETVARLTTGRDQHAQLSEAAQQAEAQVKGDQDEVANALKAQNDAIKGTGPAGDGNFPELNEPHLVLASPAGIETSTAKSTHLASVEHNALTSGGHTSISAAKSFLASAREAIRLFAYDSVIKLVAARADIDIVALKTNIKLLAKLQVTVTANKISIRAGEELELGGGGSCVRYDNNGVTTMTPGAWVVHAASNLMTGPATRNIEGHLPSSAYQGCDPAVQSAAATQSGVVKLG